MFKSLTTRLIVWVLALAGAVYLVTIGWSNFAGRQSAMAAAEREATNATEAAGRRVEDVLHTVEESTRALARAISTLNPGPADVDRLVRTFADQNHSTVASYAIVLPTTAMPPAWYAEAFNRNTAGWTEPYRDRTAEGATVVTFAVPFTSSGAPAAAFAAASLRLDFLSTIVREVHLGQSGFALVVSRRRLLIAHSRRDLSDAIHDPMAELTPALRAVVEPVLGRAEAGESGFIAAPIDGRTYRLTMRPVGQAGWTMATAYPEDELLAGVSSLWRTQIAIAISGLILLAVAVVVLAGRITKPLVALSRSAAYLATGNLDGPLPEATSRDEVGGLTTAFRDMRDSLKTHIRDLEETTKAKARLETEMKAARRIQADMLPAPNAGGAASGYELAAALTPARAVGGDLFDHFEQGTRVFFLVGDVSGKGVGAALFMARAKTLFDAIAATAGDPGSVLATLNRSLCRQNDAGMFVTAVCGVLDLGTRQIALATAGHEPPVLIRANGRSEMLTLEGGRVLGLLEFGDYPVTTISLAEQEAIVMYTDGVSEAQNPADDFFGAERLLASTTRDAAGPAAAITAGLLRDVQTFADTAPQSDDITILTIKVT
jgi:sigma-B regulation protein RsbU (phosphoserine phosphatase)